MFCAEDPQWSPGADVMHITDTHFVSVGNYYNLTTTPIDLKNISY